MEIARQVNANLARESAYAQEKTGQFVTLSTVFFSMSIATSLTTALLIALRIISVERMTRKAGVGTGKTYNFIIEVVVESAAIYSATLLTYIIVITGHHTATALYYAENIYAQFAVRPT